MKLKAVLCAAAVCGGVSCVAAADTAVAEAEKGEVEKKPVATAEFALAFDSKYLSYSFVDNKDPILTPAASVRFFDWVCFSVEAIFDTTKYGRKAGYTNRQWKYTELHPDVWLSHKFTPEDWEWLPTAVELSVDYQYEYHPNAKRKGVRPWDSSISEDTQFVCFDVSLPDLWLEPHFWFERDIMRDNGTYMALDVGHTFNLLGGDDDTLTLKPSVMQGFGNAQRVRAYASTSDGEPLDHAGLMDTVLKLELAWKACEHVELGAYLAYSDFLFDRKIREAARRYEATGHCDESWNVTAGLSAKVTF